MTKSDKTRQLTTKQLSAINLLISGKNDSEVAEAVGVARQTVNGWRNNDAPFVAELNARRQELWEVHIEQLRGSVSMAIRALLDELNGDDPKLRHSAAVIILKAVGLFGASLYPEGETDPDTVETAWKDERLRKSLESASIMMQTNRFEYEDSALVDK
jgi:hypothetical protein